MPDSPLPDHSLSISLKDFQRDGYIALEPLFDQAAMQDINDNMRRFIRDVVPTMPPAQVYYEDKNNKTTLKQLQRLYDHDSFFSDLMSSSIVHGIAQTLLQDEVIPINMQYFNKPKLTGQATPPHQDGYYFHLDPCEAVTGWLALEDVDQENGCVHYVRGSHQQQEFRSHQQTGVIGFSQGITDFGTPEDVANTVSFPGAAGTFLMHHAKTIHFAPANRSSRTRRALGFVYYAKRAREDVQAKEAYQRALALQLKKSARI